MAKQAGELLVTGSYAGICFYESDGQFLARTESRLAGTNTSKDPRFRRSMHNAAILGKASHISAKAYKLLPIHQQTGEAKNELLRIAMKMIAGGAAESEVLSVLQQPLDPAALEAARLRKALKPAKKRKRKSVFVSDNAFGVDTQKRGLHKLSFRKLVEADFCPDKLLEQFPEKPGRITRRQVKTDPRFANTRKENDIFRNASIIGTAIYLQIKASGKPTRSGLKGNPLRYHLSDQAKQMLRQGLNCEAVKTRLTQRYLAPAQQ
ncbi:MAG TPA: hypothetical protein VF145_07230, partial [Chitinophagaceae bacterium]